MRLLALLLPLALLLSPSLACADWTPLITATDFDGPRADVLTMAGGIVSLVLIIAGLGFLITTITRR